MVEEFAGMTIAVLVVTASIILAGILIGLGRAFGYKRIEQFGIEELVQSIINAALIGAFATIIAFAGEASLTLSAKSGCVKGSVVDQLSCTFSSTSSLLFSASYQLTQTLNIIGYYQGMNLNFGAFSIAPFANLAAVSATLSSQLLVMNGLLILLGLNEMIALFIKQNALVLLFPLGLVLRTLFATRRVGGFLIALAIGLYLFYPSFAMIFPPATAELNTSISLMRNFTNNTNYAPAPIVDLNDNYAIGRKIDLMSGRCPKGVMNGSINGTVTLLGTGNSSTINLTNPCTNMTADMSGDLTLIIQNNDEAISKSILQSVIAPLFSLLITVIFVKELSGLLGGELGIKTIAAI